MTLVVSETWRECKVTRALDLQPETTMRHLRCFAFPFLLAAHSIAAAAQGNAQRAGPTMPGQSAFATIREVVGILEADSSTDWSRVNLEALRQHLIDMDEVTLRASVRQVEIPSGASIDVTGTGATVGSIQRMLGNHAGMLDQSAEFHAVATPIATGVRLTVVARDTTDVRLVSRIRGLGFAGLLVQGDHHAAHHLAIARGNAHAHVH